MTSSDGLGGSVVMLKIIEELDGFYAVLEINGEVVAKSRPYATLEEVRTAKQRFAASVDTLYPGTRLQRGGRS